MLFRCPCTCIHLLVLQVSVAENLLAGQAVVTVQASDEDPGRYGELSYSITSEDAMEMFTIRPETGELAHA